MDNNEKKYERFYSSLGKPPHCNVYSERTHDKYDRLINVISPNYLVLFIKITLLVFVGYIIFPLLTSGQGNFALDTSTPKGYLTLIPIVILATCVIYHVWLMTRKLKLYEKGLVICGLGHREFFYNEVLGIEQSYETERKKNITTDIPYYKKLMIYLISLQNGKEIVLRKRHYFFLKSKLEDLKANLVEN